MKNLFRFSGIFLISNAFACYSLADTTVNIGGRIHVDANFYNDDVTDLASGTEIRRVRLFAKGEVDGDYAYKVQLDFADGEVDPKDVYISYSGFDLGTLYAGNFKVPFGLEEQNSSNTMTFIERSMANVMSPSRRIGFGIKRSEGNKTFAASVFGDEAGDSGQDEGVGIAGRFTIAPKLENGFMHFGVAAAIQEPNTTDSGTDTFRLRSRPEAHVTNTRLINTGNIAGVSNITRLGLEAGANIGEFSITGEYITTRVDAATQNYDFDGYYAAASWTPGGQKRTYKNGAFSKVDAKNAWQFGIRYSFLGLDDADINGGEETNITLAANYYVNPNLRVQANYILTDVKGGINGDEDPSILLLRASLVFK